MSQNQNTKTDVPEIPPEIQNRRPVALTQLAAESDGLDEVCVPDNNSGITRQSRVARPLQVDMKQVAALNELTKAPPGFEPCAAMTASQVHAIMAKTYPGQPTLDPHYGDMTASFIVWLFENHPADAHVRYYTRLMPNLGVWMARTHPKFRYVPGKRQKLVVKPVAVESAPPSENEELVCLRAENARLKANQKPKAKRAAQAKPAVKQRVIVTKPASAPSTQATV